MIEIMFAFGTEHVLVRVQGRNVSFGNTGYGAQMATIEGLRLDKAGVMREFPDLKDNPNWRIEAIGRFKDTLKDLDNENAICSYLIEDLKKFGYVPLYKQKSGMRREIL